MPPAVCLMEKPVGKPDAVAPHVRFDERGWETGLHATAPILDSTGRPFWIFFHCMLHSAESTGFTNRVVWIGYPLILYTAERARIEFGNPHLF